MCAQRCSPWSSAHELHKKLPTCSATQWSPPLIGTFPQPPPASLGHLGSYPQRGRDQSETVAQLVCRSHNSILHAALFSLVSFSNRSRGRGRAGPLRTTSGRLQPLAVAMAAASLVPQSVACGWFIYVGYVSIMCTLIYIM
jgi:hypothetical protein